MLEKILKECIRINKKDGLDCFYRFNGHVDNIDIEINKDTTYDIGDDANKIYSKTVYFDGQLKNEDLLKKVLKELKEF